MLEKLRSTILYKICGYFSYIYITLIALYALFVNNSSGWTPVVLLALLPIFVIGIPILLIVMFITLIVVYHKTKNLNINTNTNIFADIGNVINSLFLLIGLGLLEMIVRLGY